MLTDDELLRYSRQIMLQQIDIAGQEKLKEAHVVVLGVGGLGSPVAMYLAAAGVGKLTLIDDDQVDTSNLQRQIIHHQSAQGYDKVKSAKTTLLSINPDCQVVTINQRLSSKQLQEILESAQVLVDCCDNFDTRFLTNEVCFNQKVPLVSGAAIRLEGQLTTFLMDGSTACYECLYDRDSYTDQSCSENGVLGPVVGIIGSMQALETIKLITGAGQVLSQCLVLFDGSDMSFNKIKFKQKKGCPTCSSHVLDK